MAWFKKERKPRVSQRARLEIPRDAWDKGGSNLFARFARAPVRSIQAAPLQLADKARTVS